MTQRVILKDCHHENFHLFNDSLLLNPGRHPGIRAGAGKFTGCRDQPSRTPSGQPTAEDMQKMMKMMEDVEIER